MLKINLRIMKDSENISRKIIWEEPWTEYGINYRGMYLTEGNLCLISASVEDVTIFASLQMTDGSQPQCLNKIFYPLGKPLCRHLISR